MAPVPIFVSSLKDPTSVAFVETALADLAPSAIITATAFATGAEPGVETLFDRAGVPVFQVIVATTRREAWAESQRGLAPADLAMHVVMPELDGRILAGAIAFKAETETDAALAFRAFANRPEPDRVAQVADRIAAFIRLQRTPRAERKLAVLIPDYPSAPGRTGYAVGLDVPASVLAMLHDLKQQGYGVEGIPEFATRVAGPLERRRPWIESRRLYPALRRFTLRSAQVRRSCMGQGEAEIIDDPDASRRPHPPAGTSPVRQGGQLNADAPSPRPYGERVRVRGGSPVQKLSNATLTGQPSPSAPPPSATSPSLSPRIADARPTAAPTITTRPCRRAMRCLPSAYGCANRSASTPSSMSARTARWNGCRARPSR